MKCCKLDQCYEIPFPCGISSHISCFCKNHYEKTREHRTEDDRFEHEVCWLGDDELIIEHYDRCDK